MVQHRGKLLSEAGSIVVQMRDCKMVMVAVVVVCVVCVSAMVKVAWVSEAWANVLMRLMQAGGGSRTSSSGEIWRGPGVTI